MSSSSQINAPKNFYPRSPRGERRCSGRFDGQCLYYFYPRSPRGERPYDLVTSAWEEGISIHAPREGSDLAWQLRSLYTDIYFYPRSPRGERLVIVSAWGRSFSISIHAPREGSDPPSARRPLPKTTFLSTLPARGATGQGWATRADINISIHAPREGSDTRPPYPCGASHISIHAPREGSDAEQYQATFGEVVISIHAPREGSDWARGHLDDVEPGDFYPRSPRGERPLMMMGL